MPPPDPSALTPPPDPAVAPRASATVLMVRDGAHGLEVFMIERHQGSNVLGGAYVFPGGKVDADDASPALLARLDTPLPALRERLHEPDLDDTAAGALHVAAVREAFEECGVLFARGGPAALAEASTPAAAGAPPEAFGALLERLELRLDDAALHPFSRWITPEQSMLMPNRRFDTRFFLATLPAGGAARHDNREAVHSAWLRPRDALARCWTGQIMLAPPQIMSLDQLGRAPDVATLLRDTQARAPCLVQPQVCRIEGETVMAYPGDPLHPVRARAMPGPLRLWVRGARFEPEGGLDAFCG